MSRPRMAPLSSGSGGSVVVAVTGSVPPQPASMEDARRETDRTSRARIGGSSPAGDMNLVAASTKYLPSTPLGTAVHARPLVPRMACVSLTALAFRGQHAIGRDRLLRFADEDRLHKLRLDAEGGARACHGSASWR